MTSDIRFLQTIDAEEQGRNAVPLGCCLVWSILSCETNTFF